MICIESVLHTRQDAETEEKELSTTVPEVNDISIKVQLFKWDHSKFSSQVTDTVHRNRYLFIFFYSFVFLFFFDGPQIILFRYSLFYHVLYSCLPLDSDHALRWTTFLTSFHNDRTGNVVINCHGIMKCFSLSHALDKTKTFFFQKFIC